MKLRGVSPIIKKGDIIKLTFDDLSYGGESVGHYKGFAVFVPGGIPGEKAEIEIIQKKKSYARGKLKKIIVTSETRINPRCKVFEQCGGCQLQHINYQAQLQHKKKTVEDLLKKIAHINIEVNTVIKADYPWYYRNKAQYPLTKNENGRINTGFYKKGTHKIISNQKCYIQHQLINRTIRKTLKILNQYQLSVYNENKNRGLLRHLIVRVGVCTNQAILVFVTSREKFNKKNEIAEKIMDKVPELIGVLQNINPQKTNVITGEKTILLKGKEKYTDYIGNKRFEISPLSFFQTNSLQTEKLYRQVIKYGQLQMTDTVIDAYSGIGTIGLYLAGKVNKVYGIEENKEAVKDAINNAEINKIKNCEFIQGTVEKRLPELIKKGIKPDLVIFDPPRKGLTESFRDYIINLAPERLVYVSCNPATLARDLKYFKEKYRITGVQPVDMFPQTYHIECVVLMSRK